MRVLRTGLIGAGLSLAALIGSGVAQGEQVTLHLSLRAAAANVVEFYQGLGDEFAKLHPGVRVEVTNAGVGAYTDQIKTQIAGGSAPDVIYLHYSMFPDFAQNNLLLHLKPYIERDHIDTSEYYPATLAQFSAGGRKDFALPRETSSIVLFYNKDLFNNAGVGSPDLSWTYDSLKTAATKLTRRDGDTLAVSGFDAPTAYWQRRQVAWSWGGEVLSSDLSRYILADGPGVEAYQYLADMIQEGISTDDGAHRIANGHAAMEFGGFWYINSLNKASFDWGMAVLPSGPANRYVRLAGGAMAIPAASAHPDLAWELLKFVNSPEALAELGSIGDIIPANREAAQSPVFQSSLPEGAGVFIDSLQYGHIDPGVTRFSELNSVMDKALRPVWSGESSAKQALTAVAPQVQALLEP